MPKSKLYYTARWRHHVRKQALYNAGYQCARCHTDLSNAGKRAQVHHIIPLKRLPHHGFDQSNLELLCVPCHNKQHDRGPSGARGCDVNGLPLDPHHPWASHCDGGE